NDVDQLGQFIEAEFAQDTPDGSNARIVAELEDGAAHFVQAIDFVFALLGVCCHGSKLEHGEGPAIEAAALLAEKDWTGGTDPNRDGNERIKQRARKNEEKLVDRHINDVLASSLLRHLTLGSTHL